LVAPPLGLDVLHTPLTSLPKEGKLRRRGKKRQPSKGKRDLGGNLPTPRQKSWDVTGEVQGIRGS